MADGTAPRNVAHTRPLQDLLDEVAADARPIGDIPTSLAKGDVYRVAKVDDELGIVFGFAAVCTVNGRPYEDTQRNTIPEKAMLKAAATFMEGDRPLGEMHRRTDAGQVVFGFPLTSDIAQALGVQTSKTGFIVGVKPDPATLAKYRSGELRSFSIGGRHRIVDGKAVA